MKNKIKKTISLFLISTFVWTQIVDATALPKINIIQTIELATFPDVKIPQDLASIDDFYLPQKHEGKFVFYIQNAHANYSAQKQIKNLLKYLQTQYGIRTVFVEGAASELDPDNLRMFDDDARNFAFADNLAQKGELSGAEWFLIENKNVSGKPIENIKTYADNYSALQTVLSQSEAVERFLEKFEHALYNIAAKKLSQKALKIIKEWKLFQKGNRQFVPYLEGLARDAQDILGINLNAVDSQFDWQQISRVLELQSIEKLIDIKLAQSETEQILEFLKAKKISKKIISDFENRIFTRGNLEQFFAESKPNGFQFKNYPNFSLLAATEILGDEIDHKMLFVEIRNLFALILDKLTVGEQEKQVWELYKNEELLRKLLSLSLSRDEWKMALQNKAVIKLPAMVSGAAELVYSKFADTELAEINQIQNEAFRFYELANEREKVFWENTKGDLSDREGTVVFVTGGFHTRGIADIFRERGIGYVVLTPKFIAESGDNAYREIMLRSKQQTFELSYLDSPARAQKFSVTAEQIGLDAAVNSLAPVVQSISEVAPAGDIPKAIEAFNDSIFAKNSGLEIASTPIEHRKSRPVFKVMLNTGMAREVERKDKLLNFKYMGYTYTQRNRLLNELMLSDVFKDLGVDLRDGKEHKIAELGTGIMPLSLFEMTEAFQKINPKIKTAGVDIFTARKMVIDTKNSLAFFIDDAGNPIEIVEFAPTDTNGVELRTIYSKGTTNVYPALAKIDAGFINGTKKIAHEAGEEYRVVENPTETFLLDMSRKFNIPQDITRYETGTSDSAIFKDADIATMSHMKGYLSDFSKALKDLAQQMKEGGIIVAYDGYANLFPLEIWQVKNKHAEPVFVEKDFFAADLNAQEILNVNGKVYHLPRSSEEPNEVATAISNYFIGLASRSETRQQEERKITGMTGVGRNLLLHQFMVSNEFEKWTGIDISRGDLKVSELGTGILPISFAEMTNLLCSINPKIKTVGVDIYKTDFVAIPVEHSDTLYFVDSKGAIGEIMRINSDFLVSVYLNERTKSKENIFGFERELKKIAGKKSLERTYKLGWQDFEVYFDPAEKFLNWASGNGNFNRQNASLYQGDASSEQLKNSDIVIMAHVEGHLKSRGLWGKTLRELARNIKSGGVILSYDEFAGVKNNLNIWKVNSEHLFTRVDNGFKLASEYNPPGDAGVPSKSVLLGDESKETLTFTPQAEDSLATTSQLRRNLLDAFSRQNISEFFEREKKEARSETRAKITGRTDSGDRNKILFQFLTSNTFRQITNIDFSKDAPKIVDFGFGIMPFHLPFLNAFLKDRNPFAEIIGIDQFRADAIVIDKTKPNLWAFMETVGNIAEVMEVSQPNGADGQFEMHHFMKRFLLSNFDEERREFDAAYIESFNRAKNGETKLGDMQVILNPIAHFLEYSKKRQGVEGDFIRAEVGSESSEELKDADVILMSHVTVHYTRDGMKELIGSVLKQMKPGGVVVEWTYGFDDGGTVYLWKLGRNGEATEFSKIAIYKNSDLGNVSFVWFTPTQVNALKETVSDAIPRAAINAQTITNEWIKSILDFTSAAEKEKAGKADSPSSARDDKVFSQIEDREKNIDIDLANKADEMLPAAKPDEPVSKAVEKSSYVEKNAESYQILFQDYWDKNPIAQTDTKKLMNRMSVLSKTLSKLLSAPDAMQNALHLKRLLDANFKSKKLLPEAEKMIRSFLNVYELRRNGEPINVGYVISMYGEADRLNAESLDNLLGEDALAEKIAELDELYSVNLNVHYRLLLVDDGEFNGQRDKSDETLSFEIVPSNYRENFLQNVSSWINKNFALNAHKFLHEFFDENKNTQFRVKSKYGGISSGETALQILQERFADKLKSGQVKVFFVDKKQKKQISGRKGSGVILGMRKAINDGADYVIFTGTDRTIHTGQSGLLLSDLVAGKTDVVIGSRRLSDSIVYGQSNGENRASFLYNKFARLFLRAGKIKDTQEGFKGFTRDILERILPVDNAWYLDEKFTYDYTFDTHLLMRARDVSDKPIKEVSTVWINNSRAGMRRTNSEQDMSLIKKREFKRLKDYKRAIESGKYENGGLQKGSMVDLRGIDKRVIFVGDIHGRVDNLNSVLERNNNFEDIADGNAVLILTGDIVHSKDEYLNRTGNETEFGENSYEAIKRVMDLKIMSPQNVYLLGADHEQDARAVGIPIDKRIVNQSQNYFDYLEKFFGDNFLKQYRRAMSTAPILAIGSNFLAAHAGPIKRIRYGDLPNNLEEFLTSRNDLFASVNNGIVDDLIGIHNRVDVGFGEEEVIRFFELFGMDPSKSIFITGHSPEDPKIPIFQPYDSKLIVSVAQFDKFAWEEIMPDGELKVFDMDSSDAETAKSEQRAKDSSASDGSYADNLMREKQERKFYSIPRNRADRAKGKENPNVRALNNIIRSQLRPLADDAPDAKIAITLLLGGFLNLGEMSNDEIKDFAEVLASFVQEKTEESIETIFARHFPNSMILSSEPSSVMEFFDAVPTEEDKKRILNDVKALLLLNRNLSYKLVFPFETNLRNFNENLEKFATENGIENLRLRFSVIASRQTPKNLMALARALSLRYGSSTVIIGDGKALSMLGDDLMRPKTKIIERRFSGLSPLATVSRVKAVVLSRDFKEDDLAITKKGSRYEFNIKILSQMMDSIVTAINGLLSLSRSA